MHISTRQDDFYVPTIDVGPYLLDPDSAAASDVIDQVRAACISTGFFQITGHGISKDLQKSVFEAAAEFFALPLDEKRKLDAKKSIGHRGYDLLASQSYEEGVEPDLKEASVLVKAAFFSLPLLPLNLLGRFSLLIFFDSPRAPSLLLLRHLQYQSI